MHFQITAGCFYANASRPVGIFHLGCENTCHCARSDGHVVCGPRCEPPFHRYDLKKKYVKKGLSSQVCFSPAAKPSGLGKVGVVVVIVGTIRVF